MDARNLRADRGRLIAIEGIDQSGKRTQAQLLARALRSRRIECSVMNFPDYKTPLGRQLKAYLRGRNPLDYRTVHMLYAANKWEKADQIKREMVSGRTVIVNRYSPSNLAYGVAHGLPLEWLEWLEKDLPKPNLVLLLDVTPKTSFKRKKQLRDVHEGDVKYLQKVRRVYLKLAKKYRWEVTDGSGDPQTVQQELRRHIFASLRTRKR